MKKLLAIFLSATLMVSTMSGLFVANATTNMGNNDFYSFTETYNGKTAEVTLLGKNLAEAAEGENTLSTFPAANYEAGETVPARLNYDVAPDLKHYSYSEDVGYTEITSMGTAAKTMLKEASRNTYVKATSQGNGNGFNAECAIEAIVYEYDTPTTIYDFILGNSPNAQNLYTGAFKLYIGNDMNTIFDDANCYYEYDYTAADGYNSAAGHIVHFPEGVTGKYVVCAVSEPAAGHSSRALRVTVFGLYGKSEVATATESFAAYTASNITDKSNLVGGKAPVAYNSQSMGGSVNNSMGNKGQLTNTTSASTMNGSMLTGGGAGINIYFGNDGVRTTDTVTKIVDRADNYIEAVWQLDAEAEISDVAIYWSDVLAFCSSHYIVSMADTKEALFGADAYNVEMTKANNSIVISPKKGTTAQFVGVKILCGVSEAIIGHGTHTNNYSTARIGHVDVHGTYVTGIKDSDITVSTNTEGVTVSKSDIVIADGAIADADGLYPLGSVSTTLTVDKLAFNANKVDYTFKGWKLAGGEIIEGSNVENFVYTPTTVPCELEAVYEGVAATVADVNLANITFDKYKETNVTGKANLVAGKLPVAYNGRSLGGDVVNCLGTKSTLTDTTSADAFNGTMLNGGGSGTYVYFANEGTRSSSRITNLVDREDNYLEFIYALDGNAKISDVSIYWSSHNEFAAKHYIVSMADTQEDLFTESALTVEVKEAALTSSIVPKAETTVNFVGVRIICGVSDAIIDHPSYTDNYATARLGRLDVHGAYVNAIGNDDITVSTEAPGVNVAKSDIAGINADAAGKYPLGLAKTTLTVDKTNFSDGNVDYTFLGWKPANGEIIEGSNVASFEYTPTAPTELIAVYNSAVYYTVKFADRQGRIVHTVKVPADGYLSTEDIAEASDKLPEIFGYNKKLDEGVQVWNGDTTGTITCDTTFAAVYELDTETKYTVNDQEICFDQKMISQSDEPVSWFVNGVFADYGTKFTFYVFGDMKVTMSTAAAPTEPTVSILGSAEKGNMFATFVRVYNPSNEAILSLGTRFTSATVYNQMNGAEWDDESLKSVLADFEARKTEYVADAFLTNTAAKDYMTILSPVAEGKKRYAKAFIETANGFIFSEICGNRATQQ